MTLLYPKPQKARKADKTTNLEREYMGHVASLPCRCCGRIVVEVHHCFCGRYSQARAPHYHTIPLCYEHHRGESGIHARKAGWMAEYGPDHDFIAQVQFEIEQSYGFRVPNEYRLI